MRPEERDAALIWDMLENARTVAGFVRGKTVLGYQRERLLRLATERALEIVGEAARHVSQTLRDADPEIQWARIIGFRNVLAHEYGEILDEKVWEIAATSVPELIARLEPLLPPVPIAEP